MRKDPSPDCFGVRPSFVHGHVTMSRAAPRDAPLRQPAASDLNVQAAWRMDALKRRRKKAFYEA
jgi:hypothetical protein